MGEVVQESEEKRLLFLYRVAPEPEQRHCVYLWAKRNHLTLVIINAVNDPISDQELRRRRALAIGEMG